MSGRSASVVEGAAIHPTFLRVGPWALSIVVAALFGLSFATSYAALHDYALQLQFGREFAIVFPLVLDAVISVLAVTVLLERALRRRTVTIKVRYADFKTVTRSHTLSMPTDDADLIASWALELLARTEAGQRPVRLLGVRVQGLIEQPAS
jgi:hypothetical protein